MRRARFADLDALVALESRFPSDRISRRSFRRLLMRASAEIWVCTAGGKVVGDAVILYRAGSRRARLYSIVSDAAFRQRGVGAQLLGAVERQAVARRCLSIGLEVRASAACVIRWYRRRGYLPGRSIAGYYDDGESALRMRKEVASCVVRRRPSRRAD